MKKLILYTPVEYTSKKSKSIQVFACLFWNKCSPTKSQLLYNIFNHTWFKSYTILFPIGHVWRRRNTVHTKSISVFLQFFRNDVLHIHYLKMKNKKTCYFTLKGFIEDLFFSAHTFYNNALAKLGELCMD